jgi:hypothetical protein
LSPLTLPIPSPCIYWGFAIILSLYYGIRGIYYQRHYVAIENEKNGSANKWSLFEQIIVHRIPDFILHFVCSMSGFLCYYVAGLILAKIPDISRIDAGTGIVLSFLFLVAITGIAGVLPPLLMLGKFPK